MNEAASKSGPTANRSIVSSRSSFEPRHIKDRAAKLIVWIGGLGVIGALLLIFVYLASEVAPLFGSAEVKARETFVLPGDQGETLFLASEEQGEVGLRVSSTGQITFFDLFTGQARQELQLPVQGRQVQSVFSVDSDQGLLAASLDDGSVLMFRHQYRQTYPNDQRVITAEISYPRGEQSLNFTSVPVQGFAARDNGQTLMMVGADAQGAIQIKRYVQEISLFGDSTLTESDLQLLAPKVSPDILLLNPLLQWLYVIDKDAGKLALYQFKGEAPPELIDVQDAGAVVHDASYLAGGISVIAAQENGRVSQWFPARTEEGKWYLAHVRDFRLPGDAAATAIGPELRRRGFAVGDASGSVTMFYATSGARTHKEKIFDTAVERLTFNSRAQVRMALSADGKLRVSDVHNEHPEVSMSALWSKVWYESYDKPDFIWQSSSASADFEPKFSLMPLSFGTLKAAFYAMIFAVPLAILGAIFTANFMSPTMRQAVKPTVELMEALPTVILGFLAGLWMAPFVETNLLGVFLTLGLLPLSLPLFGFLWLRMPRSIRLAVPPGWEAAMIIPVIAFVVWLCFFVAKPMEAVFFSGNMQAWMDQTLGISYDQRNALVVGIAMGIAVIPTIYSITEDAIFSVPKHLSLGSLALGATAWQTLIGVVLPTASPGIFSAVMIGMGRAVGETMIVLMATGNTAVMDPSMFEGLRTLSANIAVEVPESEVGSTHFRLLFLAGLVLFMFTFAFNTLAEVVRQRLRRKYASL